MQTDVGLVECVGASDVWLVTKVMADWFEDDKEKEKKQQKSAKGE